MATATKPIDWDSWRASYDELSFADQQAFYACVLEQHPEQASYNLSTCQVAFDRIDGDNLAVVELGGWDGRLARDMIQRPDVASWTNYDIADVPQVCTAPGYRQIVLTDYLWNHDEVYSDVFVACHTIEHMRMAQLILLMEKIRAPWVYFEAPIGKEKPNWAGYVGSHIIEEGWPGVEEMMAGFGYGLIPAEYLGCRLWRRER